MTLYVVLPAKNDDETWLVVVRGSLQENRFSSFELACAYVYWLAMKELLALWNDGNAELGKELGSRLSLMAEDFRDLCFCDHDSQNHSADLKQIADRTSELSQELDVFFVAHGIQLDLFKTLEIEHSLASDVSVEVSVEPPRRSGAKWDSFDI